jgi:hypothetical protein
MTKIQNNKQYLDVTGFGHGILKFEIYPSTLLGMVRLSNHLEFGAWNLRF